MTVRKRQYRIVLVLIREAEYQGDYRYRWLRHRTLFIHRNLKYGLDKYASMVYSWVKTRFNHSLF